MIPGEFYEYIYIIFVALISIPLFKEYSNRQNPLFGTYNVRSRFPEIFLVIILVLFIGFRPADKAFYDTMFYYDVIANRSLQFYGIDYEVENLIFDNVLFYFSYKHWSYTVFFLLIASIYFVCSYIATRKLFPKDTLFAYLVFLAAFSTFSYSVNGIKAGAASSIFLLGLAYREKLLISIPLVLLSWGIHHSMSFPIAVYVVVLLYSKPKCYFYFWGGCLLMALLHITTFQEIFAGYTDEKGVEYLTTTGDDWKGKGGLRPDFILYSMMPVILGWYATQKLKIQNKTYNLFLCYYLLSNAIWMLCMYVNYNNRIAYLSWFVYPFLIVYPLLECDWKESRYQDLVKYAKYHLYFTLFMVLIYYGLSTIL